MGFKDRHHPVEEFDKFPWGEISPEDYGKGWASHNNQNHRLIIEIFHDDLSADIWVVPEALEKMIETREKVAVATLQRSLRGLLGCGP